MKVDHYFAAGVTRSLIVAWMALSASPALAQGEITRQLVTVSAAPAVTVYTAKKILTMEPANPEASAVAVAGKRILAVGSLSEVKAALGDRPFTLNETFKSKIVLPGLIDQHLHPFLGALTLSTEVIATEDWVLPGRTFRATHIGASRNNRLNRLSTRYPTV